MKEAINKFYSNDLKIEFVENWKDYDKDSVIYEVLKIIDGKPLFYEEHYIRLENSFKLKGFNFDFTQDEIKELIQKLVRENEVLNGNIKIIYNLQNKNLRIFFVKHSYPTDDMYKFGVDTIVYHGERNNPNIKEINVGFRENVNREIKKNNVYEAILVDNNGLITEGSRSNIFFIKGDSMYTSKIEDVLPGVTRTEILKEAKKLGIMVKETDIELKHIKDYDAAFISGTSPNILPIRRIGESIFDVNNSIMRNLMKSFNIRMKKYINL